MFDTGQTDTVNVLPVAEQDFESGLEKGYINIHTNEESEKGWS